MPVADDIKAELKKTPRRWLVTGAAGFIGSHLVRNLLNLGQHVVGLDDLSSGRIENIVDLNLNFVKGDIRELSVCEKACENIDFILHHAAVASVIKSLEDPEGTNGINIDGFENILKAAANKNVKRIVYASSSAVYGDGFDQLRREDEKSSPRSPYARAKYCNEISAQKSGLETMGLRYFNIFGPRQDPAGGYAAVIPKWVASMLQDETPEIYGDGKTIRDFCYVDNAVQANILAALTQNKSAMNQVYNIGCGQAVSLNELYELISKETNKNIKPLYRDFRAADIRISQADISKAKSCLNFMPLVNLKEGLTRTVQWYKRQLND
jgi:UDP-N-acetylglucosamine 4-epimerase